MFLVYLSAKQLKRLVGLYSEIGRTVSTPASLGKFSDRIVNRLDNPVQRIVRRTCSAPERMDRGDLAIHSPRIATPRGSSLRSRCRPRGDMNVSENVSLCSAPILTRNGMPASDIAVPLTDNLSNRGSLLRYISAVSWTDVFVTLSVCRPTTRTI